ncbi:MAG: hypothetical protein MJ233_03575 [Mycoplasmoidaceae bacterium]|nr:hypothetical protein [Mycoplasmoidaceae bacterium]
MPTVLVVGAIPTISLVSCNPTQPPEPGPSLELSHEYHTLIDRYPYSCLYSDPVSITAAQHITFKIDPKLGKFQMPFTIFSFGHIENDIPVQVEPIDFEIEHLYVNDSEVDKSGET